MSNVKVNVTLLGRTDLSILVTDGKCQTWVPISQVAEEIEEPKGPLNMLTTVAIVIPDWLAQEKGLQQCYEDEDTLDLFGEAS